MTSSRMPGTMFVLDTNVLMHDPSALARFEEHSIHLPMQVVEELDRHKTGRTDIARNVRTALRYLDRCQEGLKRYDPENGIPLKRYEENGVPLNPTGRLFYQIAAARLPHDMLSDTSSGDNRILAYTSDMHARFPGRVVLVSKDKNIRIKAFILGIPSEDYNTDRVVDDIALLPSGYVTLGENFWEDHEMSPNERESGGPASYRISGPEVARWYPGMFLCFESESGDYRVVSVEAGTATVTRILNYLNTKRKVWGIGARNREQNYALNLLMDPEIDFVSLVGPAGTGKTLLTLAAGLQQVSDEHRYSNIIVTRLTVPVGEDIGFLPGTEKEKMIPWMRALADNLEVLMPQSAQNGEWGRSITSELLDGYIQLRSLNFMRGGSFQNKFVIFDEAQNLTSKQMLTLISRAGPGTKVVCLGNLAQIDTPYLTETTSGLTYAVERFRSEKCPFAGHVTLQKGERSRLADFVNAHFV